MKQIVSTKVHHTLTTDHTAKPIDPPLEEQAGEHFVHIPGNGAKRQLTSGRVDELSENGRLPLAESGFLGT